MEMFNNRLIDMETDNWDFLNKKIYFGYDFQSSNLQSNDSMHQYVVCATVIRFLVWSGLKSSTSAGKRGGHSQVVIPKTRVPVPCTAY